MRRRRAGERCSCVRTGVVFTAGLVVGWLPAHWHLQAHWSTRDVPQLSTLRAHWSASELPHSSTDATTTRAAAGAVTVIGPRNNAAVVAAQLALVASKLPVSWRGVDVYYRPQEKHTTAVGRIVRAIDGLRGVDAVPLSSSIAGLSQRMLLLNADFWKNLRFDRVLWFEPGTTVLCAGSKLPLDAPAFAPYDWVGAPWKWARPGTPHSVGGNGALSLRNRAALVALFDGGFAPPTKGNEDMLFVRALGGTNARLAPKHVSRRFAVEETYDIKTTPVGVYHLMRTMPHANRTRLLDACPEAKLLFKALHDPRCKAACPRDPELLEGPLRDWTARCTGAGEDAGCELVP